MIRILVIVLLVVAAAWLIAVVIGRWRWMRLTQQLRSGLEDAAAPAGPAVLDFRELADLPAPVQRYCRTALSDGQPLIRRVHLRHHGTFNLSADGERWRPFVSEQVVVLQPAVFDWNAQVQLAPGLTVRVHDAYVAGTGVLQAAVWGLVSVMKLRGGGAIAEGELMRFAAESAWYPTVLLPGHGIRWEAVDERAAAATLTDRAVSVRLVFRFNDDGLIDRVETATRGRVVGDQIVPTPWQARVWNYTTRDGMRIPLEGEVAWIINGVERPYWRGRIEELTYEFCR